MKYNIKYKVKPIQKGPKGWIKAILISPFVFIIGIENGFDSSMALGEFDEKQKTFFNLDEKTAKKIYSRMATSGLFDIHVEKIG